jgi:hypothetical protein
MSSTLAARSVLDGGKAVAGKITYSQTTLAVTGGTANAPATTLEDLLSARAASGVVDVELWGAEAAGAILHLNGKTQGKQAILGNNVRSAVCKLCLPATATP